MLEVLKYHLSNIPDQYLLVSIWGITMLSALLSEGLTWFFSCHRKDVRDLSDRLKELKRKIVSVHEGKGDKKDDLDKLVAEFQSASSALMSKMTIANLVPLPVMIFSVTFILKNIKQGVVFLLPFTPFTLLRGFLTQGVQNAPANAVGSSFCYFVLMALNRAVVRYFLPKIYQPGFQELSMLQAKQKKK